MTARLSVGERDGLIEMRLLLHPSHPIAPPRFLRKTNSPTDSPAAMGPTADSGPTTMTATRNEKSHWLPRSQNQNNAIKRARPERAPISLAVETDRSREPMAKDDGEKEWGSHEGHPNDVERAQCTGYRNN